MKKLKASIKKYIDDGDMIFTLEQSRVEQNCKNCKDLVPADKGWRWRYKRMITLVFCEACNQLLLQHERDRNGKG